MWLMLDNHLDAEKILTKALIPTLLHTITTPREIKGLAFPEEEKDKVLELLKLQEKTWTMIKTNDDNILLMEVQGKVSKIGGHLQTWDEFSPVLEEYAELLNVKIVVSNPHVNQIIGKGVTLEPEAKEGTLFIKFYASPEKTKAKSYDEVFGFKLGTSQSDGVEYSGQGQPIIDPVSEATIAEVVGDNLYVLFDLPHNDGLKNSQKVMRQIMEQYSLLQKSPEELKKWREEAKEREAAKTKTAYVKECSKRLKAVKNELIENIGENENELNALGQRITELIRQIDEKKKQLFGFDDLEDREERFSQEYDKLLELPHVKKVLVEEGKVKVFTKTIFLESDGKVYEMGDYRIDIPTQDTDLKIANLRMEELTGQTYYHHPHITGNKDGATPCLGNISEGVMRLIGAYEFSVVAQILIEYLHSNRYQDKLTTYWNPMKKQKTA